MTISDFKNIENKKNGEGTKNTPGGWVQQMRGGSTNFMKNGGSVDAVGPILGGRADFVLFFGSAFIIH